MAGIAEPTDAAPAKENPFKEFTLRIRRYDPESGDAAYWENFTIDLPPERSVLDGILQARNAAAHRRLGQAQRPGGRRETAEVGDAFKDPKIVEIEHRSIVPSGGRCVQP